RRAGAGGLRHGFRQLGRLHGAPGLLARAYRMAPPPGDRRPGRRRGRAGGRWGMAATVAGRHGGGARRAPAGRQQPCRPRARLGRERLDAFMPRLLAEVAEQEHPDQVLERVVPLVAAVARRSAYLVLLSENPGALTRLLQLCGASPLVAEQIARFPLLLDELLNEGRLYSPPKAPELAAELRERLMRIPEDDLEQQMEALRHFKLAHSLRVIASEF